MTDFSKAFLDAKLHARQVFPEEACGIVLDSEYIRMQNEAADPAHHEEGNPDCACRLCSFKISSEKIAPNLSKIQFILHSHPNGTPSPSKIDMAMQIASQVPWGIIPITEDRVGDPVLWGDQLPISPVLGRQFIHGVNDCYSVIRDAFRLGRDGLIEQGVTSSWPYAPITLRDVPRNNEWWNSDDDLYGLLPPSHGWKEISREELQPGDAFLVRFNSDKFSHAGMLIDENLVLHHLPNRMSRREPAGGWIRKAERFLRYTGEPK